MILIKYNLMSMIHWNIIRNRNVLKFLSNNVHILNILNIIFLCIIFIYITCMFSIIYIFVYISLSIKFPLDFEILSYWNLREKRIYTDLKTCFIIMKVV